MYTIHIVPMVTAMSSMVIIPMSAMPSMTTMIFMIIVIVMGTMSCMTVMASMITMTIMSTLPSMTSMRRVMRMGTMPTVVRLATTIVGMRLLRCGDLLLMEVRGRVVRVRRVWVRVREREIGWRLGGGRGGCRGLHGHHDRRDDVLHARGKARDDLLLFGRELWGRSLAVLVLRRRGPIREKVGRDVLHRSITLAKVGSTEIRSVLLSLLVVSS